MLKIANNVDPTRVQQWLEKYCKDNLKKDVSNYAKNRLRVWLSIEPTLTSPTKLLPGLPTDLKLLDRLRELINWDFDYCLVTYSGKEAIGISAHRDASYADYEAYGWNINGECRFSYWEGRESFGYSKEVNKYTSQDQPTHQTIIKTGDIVRFNCKNLHAAEPSANRWNLNFWKQNARTTKK